MNTITTPSHYIVDGKKFDSKIQACIYGTKFNKEVFWYFHNDTFEHYNWQIEPPNSLDYYYDKRARELREQYDYLVLLYSGGSDSNNVLWSFLRQGLIIDEIVVTHSDKGTSKFKKVDINDKSSVNGLHTEYHLQILPRLKEIKDHFPNIKITLIDVTDNFIDTFSKHRDGDWVEDRSEWLNPGSTRFDLSIIRDIKQNIDKGKKAAFILGIDKPRLGYDDDNNLYTIFNDTPTTFGPRFTLTEYSNVTTELFYWHSSTCDLLAKQAHIMKKYVEANKNLWSFWKFPLTREKLQEIQEPIMRNILYTTWNSLWFQSDKPKGGWTIDIDNWFFEKDPMLEASQEIWHRGIEHVTSLTGNYVILNNGLPDGLKKFHHRYYIGKFNSTSE